MKRSNKSYSIKSEKLKPSEYLSEFVFGSIDGSVTTFAVVAGASGAHLESSIVIILGFANLIADGFSMSVGSYLSAKSEKEMFIKNQIKEYWEVENLPDSEREEIREIYRKKGFSGSLLEKVVNKITSDKDVWVDLMMKEELEMTRQSKSPFAMGLVTFLSFVTIGFIPLFIFVLNYLGLFNFPNQLFLITCLLTGICFLGIGYLKSVVNHTSKIKSIFETVLLGGSAASLAYFTGYFLEKIIS
jgi:VIT1/CCC1 family predicted Fe2+/Mn2+ transporter